MQVRNIRTSGSLPNLSFHGAQSSAQPGSMNTPTPKKKNLNHHHPFRKEHIIFPSTPCSPAQENKQFFSNNSTIAAIKANNEGSSPKISSVESLFGRPKPPPIVHKSSFSNPYIDTQETQRTSRVLDTIPKVEGVTKNKETLKGNFFNEKQNKKVTKGKDFVLREGFKNISVKSPESNSKPKITVTKPKELPKHFDFSKPEEHLVSSYLLKGAGNKSPSTAYVRLPLASVRPQQAKNEETIIGNIISTKTNELNTMTMENESSLLQTTPQNKLSVSQRIEHKIEDSIMTNRNLKTSCLAPSTETEATREIRKMSNVLTKELELKYGIKLDYSSDSAITNESEELKDETSLTMTKKPSQPVDTLEKLVKEGQPSKNEGYLITEEDRKKSPPKKSSQSPEKSRLYAMQGRMFYNLAELDKRFKETREKTTLAIRSTKKHLSPEDYQPVIASSDGGIIIQPKYMKNMGSMCYTELWPKNLGLKVRKMVIKGDNPNHYASEKHSETARAYKRGRTLKGPTKSQDTLQAWYTSREFKGDGALQLNKPKSNEIKMKK